MVFEEMKSDRRSVISTVPSNSSSSSTASLVLQRIGTMRESKRELESWLVYKRV